MARFRLGPSRRRRCFALHCKPDNVHMNLHLRHCSFTPHWTTLLLHFSRALTYFSKYSTDPAFWLAAVDPGSRPVVVRPQTYSSEAFTSPALMNFTYMTNMFFFNISDRSEKLVPTQSIIHAHGCLRTLDSWSKSGTAEAVPTTARKTASIVYQ